MPGRGRPFRPGQSGNPGGARAFPHKTWPLARDILHKTILANQAAFAGQAADDVACRQLGHCFEHEWRSV